MATSQLAQYPEPTDLLVRAIAAPVLASIASAGFSEFMAATYGIETEEPEPTPWLEWSDHDALLAHDNEQGDNFVAVFCAAGVVIQGFAHEYPMTPYRTDPPTMWPGMFRGLPSALDEALQGVFEGGEGRADATFCIWWTPATGWTQGVTDWPDDPWYAADPNGAGFVLRMLSPGAAHIGDFFSHEWGESLGGSLPPALVERVCRHDALDEALVHGLNPAADVDLIRRYAAEIGYGSAASFAVARNMTWFQAKG